MLVMGHEESSREVGAVCAVSAFVRGNQAMLQATAWPFVSKLRRLKRCLQSLKKVSVCE